MTRSEFLENVDTWGDLLSFCSDECCGYCEDIYYEDDRDEYIDNEISDWTSGWEDLYNYLDCIPTGYDFYQLCNGEWYGADDSMFDDYKTEVLEWGDNHDVWDEEDEEEDFDEDGEDDVEFEEGCSLKELFDTSKSELKTMEQSARQRQAEIENNFNEIMAMI